MPVKTRSFEFRDFKRPGFQRIQVRYRIHKDNENFR